MAPRDAPLPDEVFKPKPAGRILRLDTDWERLLHTLPSLQASAVIYRNRYSVLFKAGRFPSVTMVGDCAFHNEEERGSSMRLDHWAEAFWYEEPRDGQMHFCLEVVNELGRGIFKLCYQNRDAGLADRQRIESLAIGEGCDWDLLHVQPSNRLDCHVAKRRRLRPTMTSALRAIFSEAFEKQVELGFLLPGKAHSMWESILPQMVPSDCCWLSLSYGAHGVHLDLSGFAKAEVAGQGERQAVHFLDAEEQPAVTLVEPESCRISAMRRLRTRKSNRNDWA